jgi:hypothetical protein
MKVVTEKSITEFLKEHYKISPKRLFKKKESKKKEIMNHLFESFTEHKMRFGLMATQNPKTKQYEYYNYRSFNHIKSMKVLIQDMRKFILFKEKHIEKKKEREHIKIHNISLYAKRMQRLKQQQHREKEKKRDRERS